MLRLCEWGYKATVPDREAGQLQPDSERIRTEKAFPNRKEISSGFLEDFMRNVLKVLFADYLLS